MNDFFEDDEPADESELDYGPSKSALKRQAQATLTLTKRLCDMSSSQLDKLELSDDIRQGLALVQAIKAHGGKQRQLKLVAKKLRESDLSELEKKVQLIDQLHQNSTDHFHRLERLRDKLIEGDKGTLTNLIKDYPNVNHQQLRQLIRVAQKESEPNKKHRRALFQFLKSIILE